MIRLISLCMTAALLAGCSGSLDEPLSSDFGLAVRNNMAAHIIDPNPSLDTSPIPMDGTRASAAYGRLLTDKVKQPATADGSAPMRTSGEKY